MPFSPSAQFRTEPSILFSFLWVVEASCLLWCCGVFVCVYIYIYIFFSLFLRFATAWLPRFFWPATNLLFTLCSKPKALMAPQFSVEKVQSLYLLSSTQYEGFFNFSFLSSFTTHCAVPLNCLSIQKRRHIIQDDELKERHIMLH